MRPKTKCQVLQAPPNTLSQYQHLRENICKFVQLANLISLEGGERLVQPLNLHLTSNTRLNTFICVFLCICISFCISHFLFWALQLPNVLAISPTWPNTYFHIYICIFYLCTYVYICNCQFLVLGLAAPKSACH